MVRSDRDKTVYSAQSQREPWGLQAPAQSYARRWLSHFRRLVTRHERLITTAAGCFHLAHALPTLRRVLKRLAAREFQRSAAVLKASAVLGGVMTSPSLPHRSCLIPHLHTLTRMLRPLYKPRRALSGRIWYPPPSLRREDAGRMQCTLSAEAQRLREDAVSTAIKAQWLACSQVSC
jgi:hypothetical protein